MGSISLHHTALISIVVEGLLFGGFTTLFAYSQAILIKNGKGYNRPLWGALIVMFILALIHLATDAQRLVVAFLSASQGPEIFLSELSNPSFVFKSIIYMLQTLIGDACLIYRTFVVWNKTIWVISVPVVLLTVYFVSAIMLAYDFANAPGSSTIFALEPWAVASNFLSLGTNVLCTGLIVFRIYSLAARNRTIGLRSLGPVVAIVIESGLLYSLSVLALVVVYMVGSWGHFIVLDSICSIIGITFASIIIRVRMDRPAAAEHYSPKVITSLHHNASSLGHEYTHGASSNWTWRPDRPNEVVINITQTHHTGARPVPYSSSLGDGESKAEEPYTFSIDERSQSGHSYANHEHGYASEGDAEKLERWKARMGDGAAFESESV